MLRKRVTNSSRDGIKLSDKVNNKSINKQIKLLILLQQLFQLGHNSMKHFPLLLNVGFGEAMVRKIINNRTLYITVGDPLKKVYINNGNVQSSV